MGYSPAIELAKEKLTLLDIPQACALAGVGFQDGEPLIPWFCESRLIGSGSEAEQVLWLHYLISGGNAPLTGKLIAFRDLPGAMFYEPKFTQRSERPIIKRFGENPEQLRETGLLLGGVAAEYGDAAVTINLLPRIPVTYIIWGKDTEFPAACRILFDSSAPHFLPTEDLVVLASLGAYRLIQ